MAGRENLKRRAAALIYVQGVFVDPRDTGRVFFTLPNSVGESLSFTFDLERVVRADTEVERGR